MELKYIHFIVYSIVYTLIGAVFTALGPIVIYFMLMMQYEQPSQPLYYYVLSYFW